jgi:metal-sulfur cluster biosynthetic enzyme
MSFFADTDQVVTAVRSALSRVEDPELGGLDIVSLGLVYAIEREGDHVHVVYTLSSMDCLLGPVIERDIGDALAGIDGVASVHAELVFEPHWSPETMGDDAKFLLGVYG